MATKEKTRRKLPPRKPVDDDTHARALASRVAIGAATPDEIKKYNEERAQRLAERQQQRAERAQEFAGMEPAEMQKQRKTTQMEFERISDEMRSIPSTTPLWHDLREEKLELAFELEDMSAGDKLREYNQRREAAEKRSEDKKQYDIAKNLPAACPIPENAPGSEEPSEEEMNPELDSHEILKGGGPRTIEDYGTTKETTRETRETQRSSE
jgi:hypothetical protein